LPQAIELDLEDDLDVEPARAREILRIAQEALANALRHANAEHVSVRLGAQDGRLVLEVHDDGVGFDPDAAAVRSRRLGLTSMEERTQRLGGRLTLRSEPGAGTTVRLEATRA
jgi:signal transduction histidine kinase